MANILGYLDWRGDVPLSAVPYNDADELVLCRVAYLPFEGVLPERFAARGLPPTEAVRRLQRLCGTTGGGRRLLQPEDTILLEKLAYSQRFSTVRLTGYVSRLDAAQEKQFSALTALLPDRTVLVVFRGTDNTMVGWKEDFNMSFAEEIPAQRDAVAYLRAAAARYRFAPLRVCGHSKGGNLAVYAAAGAYPAGGQLRWPRFSGPRGAGTGLPQHCGAHGDVSAPVFAVWHAAGKCRAVHSSAKRG